MINVWTIVHERGVALSRLALASFLVLGTMSAATLEKDLSKYRNFQLGTDLAAASISAAETRFLVVLVAGS